jgi:hypothetical protein
MTTRDAHDDPSTESGPVSSGEAVTPRGGFMARPGLKPPPRHAVVVRGGDVPLEPVIPVARSSFPPPAPAEGELEPMDEPATVRAIPAMRVPRFSTVVFDDAATAPHAPPPYAPAVLESVPPPSDAPLVQSVPPVSAGSRAHVNNARWTVLLAGAAGLLLGLASVVATRSTEDLAPIAASPRYSPAAPITQTHEVLPTARDGAPPSAIASTPPAPPSSPAALVKPPVATPKKSIF